MNRLICIFLFCLFSPPVYGQSVSLTLEQAINYALKKNFSQQSLIIDKQITV